MTVRGLWLALALLASTPVSAAVPCHRYAVWRYPWPQRCGEIRAGREKAAIQFPPTREIALPLLSPQDYDTREPDAITRARLELEGYSRAH